MHLDHDRANPAAPDLTRRSSFSSYATMAAITVSQPPVPAEAFEKYPDQWIAIRDAKIVAAAPTIEELDANEAVEDTDTLFLVPDPSTHFYPLRHG